jgi:hypothetical protein
LKTEIDFRKIKTLKKVFSIQVLVRVVSAAWHDRRMASRSKIFVLARKLREQKPQPPKMFLVQVMVKMNFMYSRDPII